MTGRNIEVSVNIQIKSTGAAPTDAKAEAEQRGPGQFRIALEEEKSLDINALEDGLLRSTFPALRDALAFHLEQEVKKGPRPS